MVGDVQGTRPLPSRRQVKLPFSFAVKAKIGEDTLLGLVGFWKIDAVGTIVSIVHV
jgi:hypothetical protein